MWVVSPVGSASTPVRSTCISPAIGSSQRMASHGDANASGTVQIGRHGDGEQVDPRDAYPQLGRLVLARGGHAGAHPRSGYERLVPGVVQAGVTGAEHEGGAPVAAQQHGPAQLAVPVGGDHRIPGRRHVLAHGVRSPNRAAATPSDSLIASSSRTDAENYRG